jgi:hypothetical protein
MGSSVPAAKLAERRDGSGMRWILCRAMNRSSLRVVSRAHRPVPVRRRFTIWRENALDLGREPAARNRKWRFLRMLSTASGIGV